MEHNYEKAHRFAGVAFYEYGSSVSICSGAASKAIVKYYISNDLGKPGIKEFAWFYRPSLSLTDDWNFAKYRKTSEKDISNDLLQLLQPVYQGKVYDALFAMMTMKPEPNPYTKLYLSKKF